MDEIGCFNQENVDKFSRLAKQGEEAAKAKSEILPQLGEDALRSIWKAEVSQKLMEVTGQNEEWLKKLKEKNISKQFKSVMAGSDKGVRGGNILSTSMFPKNIAKRIYLFYCNRETPHGTHAPDIIVEWKPASSAVGTTSATT